MSFLSHELETLSLKWAVVCAEDKHLTRAFDNLSLEIAELTGDSPGRTNSKISLFSPGLMDSEISLKHFLGVHLGRRGKLSLRAQFLGLSLESLRPETASDFKVWLEGIDALVIYAPTEIQIGSAFLKWNPRQFLSLEAETPGTLFWGQGWSVGDASQSRAVDSKKSLEKKSVGPEFEKRCLESWIQRNFPHQKRYFSEKRPFFASALDWILSFS
jgi:hypothetical protein